MLWRWIWKLLKFSLRLSGMAGKLHPFQAWVFISHWEIWSKQYIPLLWRKRIIGSIPGRLLIGWFPIILSAPMLILLPPLGTFETFCAIKEMVFLQSFQMLVLLLTDISLVRSCCLEQLRYLASMTFFHQAYWSSSKLQTILPPKAKFVSIGDLIPSPPFSWLWITCFQLTKLYFFFSFFPPCHKKYLRIISILWWNEAGAWTIQNWYRGREERPDFKRTNQPAGLSQVDPHFWTFLFNLSRVVSHI